MEKEPLAEEVELKWSYVESAQRDDVCYRVEDSKHLQQEMGFLTWMPPENAAESKDLVDLLLSQTKYAQSKVEVLSQKSKLLHRDQFRLLKGVGSEEPIVQVKVKVDAFPVDYGCQGRSDPGKLLQRCGKTKGESPKLVNSLPDCEALELLGLILDWDMKIGVLDIDGSDPFALGEGFAYGSLGLHLELFLLHRGVEGLTVLLGDQKHVAVGSPVMAGGLTPQLLLTACCRRASATLRAVFLVSSRTPDVEGVLGKETHG